MWQDQLESFCIRITGREIDALDKEEQGSFIELIDIYQSACVSFFKTHNKKLSEIIT